MTRPDSGLRHGDLGATARHLCVDMQRLFAEPTDWETPWMGRVLPNVVRIVAAHPERTVFTRFRSEEHTSELQSLMRISYAVFCLKKKKKNKTKTNTCTQ